jgi:hypothetical protein
MTEPRSIFAEILPRSGAAGGTQHAGSVYRRENTSVGVPEPNVSP